MVATTVGVLALQGDAQPHVRCLEALGVRPREVRSPEQLDGLTHLVLPGGESTTVAHLLDLFGLREPLRERHARGELALFGTCAGAILLGDDDGEAPERLRLMPATFQRNAYGTQLDSFSSPIDVDELRGGPFHGIFIRAPRLRSHRAGADVLATHEGDPVLVRSKGALACTFHPELAGDSRIHELFLGMDAGFGTELGK